MAHSLPRPKVLAYSDAFENPSDFRDSYPPPPGRKPLGILITLETAFWVGQKENKRENFLKNLGIFSKRTPPRLVQLV